MYFQTITSQAMIPFKPVAVQRQQKYEAQLALYTAMHTSIRAVDHLGEVINRSHEKESDKIHLHRTKCSNIIKNVLAPHFTNLLKKELKDQPFSLLIDESTDISVQKYLGIVVIYYSNAHKKVVSTFLDLAELSECNADGIICAIKRTLDRFELSLSNLMGLGTDNASVMTGINNGVFTKLKQEVPHLVLVRCLCHSLQLAVSAAAKQFLPRNLEFLIKETYDWFSRSSSRQFMYKELYKTINDGQNPLKIIQSCQTRWLSIEGAVSRIFTQWLELKTHFNMVKLSERCYTADMLHTMYSDDSNYAYIAFLQPVLTEVNRVNKLFESKTADHTKLCNELTNLIDVLVNKITLPTNKIDIFTQNIRDFVYLKSYLGYRFENHIQKMKEQGLTPANEEAIRGRCVQFVIHLLEEIKNRLPENVYLMQNISQISVDRALRHNKNSLVDLMTHFHKMPEFIEKVEEQWRQIHLIKWTETKDTKYFWNEVLELKDAEGVVRFKELGSFAVSLLILPHSNADIERIFSQMNIIKNKQRNKMKLKLLTSILTIRSAVSLEKKCCNNYNIPAEVLRKIGTKELYSFEESTSIETGDSSEEDFP